MRLRKYLTLALYITVFGASIGAAAAQASSVTCRNIDKIGPVRSLDVYLDSKDIPENSLGINTDSFGKLLADQISWAMTMCQLKVNSKNVKIFTSRDKDFDRPDTLILYVKARSQNILKSGFGTQKYELHLLFQFFRPSATGESQIFLIEQAESASLQVNASTQKMLPTEISAATRKYLIDVTGMEDKEVLREGKYNVQ